MRVYRRRRKTNDILLEKHSNWQRGLNTLVSATQIKPDELKRKMRENIAISIRGCKIPRRMIAPKIINRKIVLNNNT